MFVQVDIFLCDLLVLSDLPVYGCPAIARKMDTLYRKHKRVSMMPAV